MICHLICNVAAGFAVSLYISLNVVSFSLIAFRRHALGNTEGNKSHTWVDGSSLTSPAELQFSWT